MLRVVIAFLMAPMIVPLAVGSLGMKLIAIHSHEPFPNPVPDWPMVTRFTIMAAVLSYGGAIMFGIPGYLWLRKQRIDAFWAWPAMGFGVGAASGVVTAFLLGLLALVTDAYSHRLPSPSNLLAAALLLPLLGIVLLPLSGPSGALVAIVHRLIAPPRQ